MRKLLFACLFVLSTSVSFAYDNKTLDRALSYKYGQCFTLKDGKIDTWNCPGPWPEKSEIDKAVNDYKPVEQAEKDKITSLKLKLGLSEDELMTLKSIIQ